MKTPPPDLEVSSILAALRDGWATTTIDLRYLPLGFGSHHWQATTPDGDRWFVTVDDLRSSHLGSGEEHAFATLETAFRTAAALRDVAQLRFAIGPVPGIDGTIVRRLGDRYAIAVFPYLETTSSGFGRFQSRADRDEASGLVGQVHNATGSIPVDALRRDTLEIHDRDRLFGALQSLEEPWTSGPYAEPARRLLLDYRASIETAFERFDRLAASVMSDSSGWVITHGEPHAANVIRTRSGDQVMVDWDTVAFGPRERDLWMLNDERWPDWNTYHEVTGVTSLSDDAMIAYPLHWSLSEIAIYTGWFREPHERTEDTEIAWSGLQQYVQDTR